MNGRRRNDGCGMQTGTLLPIRGSLVAAILGPSQATARKHKPLAWNGKNPARPGQAKHSDDVILEVRRLKEQCGMMPLAIAEHLLAMGHDVPHKDVVRICSYFVRGHLVPAEGAAPYLTAKTSA